MATGQVQVRNSEMVDNLAADFQLRNEPNFAWKSVAGLYQGLPALRGFWPMSAQWTDCQTFRLTDQSDNGFHLLNPSIMRSGYDDLIPYVSFPGALGATGPYHADACQFDLTGVESVIEAGMKGFTLGCWANITTITGRAALMGKYSAGGGSNERSYILQFAAASAVPELFVSPDGIVVTTVTSTAPPATTGNWEFIVGRYIPSTELAVWHNETKTTNVAGIPASVFNSTSALEIGNGNFAAYPFTGKMSMAFICACALSDSIIEAIWQQTRAMFGR